MSEIERAIEKKEYIERGAFLNWLNKRMDEVGTDKESRFYVNQTMTILESYPAADVEPVVRGTWEEHPIADTTDEGEQYVAMFWQCSNCHGELIYWNFQKTKYCPDCGAHMDEKDEND